MPGEFPRDPPFATSTVCRLRHPMAQEVRAEDPVEVVVRHVEEGDEHAAARAVDEQVHPPEAVADLREGARHGSANADLHGPGARVLARTPEPTGHPPRAPGAQREGG